jgi:hypothetical protein
MPLKLTTDAERVGETGPDTVIPQTVALLTPLTDVPNMHLERKDWRIAMLGIKSYVDVFDGPHETYLCQIDEIPLPNT